MIAVWARAVDLALSTATQSQTSAYSTPLFSEEEAWFIADLPDVGAVGQRLRPRWWYVSCRWSTGMGLTE